jgi:3-methylfumaryl-CoA hydratase
MADLAGWIGREQTGRDVADLRRSNQLRALLDMPAAPDGGSLAPLDHWLHFQPDARQSDMGADGHPRTGDFLPAVDLPMRMWAGGELQFLTAIPYGGAIERRSRIADVREKAGASGRLVFVTVEHSVVQGGTLAVRERQDIVYRGRSAGPSPAGEPAPAGETRRTVTPDPVMLFRYSALTFNSHRIHYDRPYATDVEGYPGLVVHGPLLATLLLRFLMDVRPGERIASFAFRAMRPVFDPQPFHLDHAPSADGHSLWVTGADGAVAMRASATVAP